jgi:hypothetical protein
MQSKINLIHPHIIIVQIILTLSNFERILVKVSTAWF